MNRSFQNRDRPVFSAKQSSPYPECTGTSQGPDPANRLRIRRLRADGFGEIRDKEEKPLRPLPSS